MIQIELSPEIQASCPDLRVLAIACQVKNSPSDVALWQEIAAEEAMIKAACRIEEINKWAPIKATRTAYKQLGNKERAFLKFSLLNGAFFWFISR